MFMDLLVFFMHINGFPLFLFLFLALALSAFCINFFYYLYLFFGLISFVSSKLSGRVFYLSICKTGEGVDTGGGVHTYICEADNL